MRNFLIKTLSSFFYAGYFPLIPGTFASALAAGLIWFLKGNTFAYALITLLTIILGFTVGTEAEKIFQKKDCGYIVIDEIAGMLLAMIFLPVTVITLFCAFILFRIFDTLKVYPADRMQQFSGSKGIMLDDIVAGLYTNLLLQLALRFFV